MRKILLLFVVLFLGNINIQAQGVAPKELPSLNDPIYNEYVIKKELWVCTSISAPVILSLDVFEISFNIFSGIYSKVTPGKPGVVLESNLGGMFNVSGSPAGVYEFIFDATHDVCEMSEGQKAVARVYLVPDLEPYNILRNICYSDRVSVNLLDFMPQVVRSFVETVGWQFRFYDPAGNMVVDRLNAPTSVLENLSKDNLGTKMYSYDIVDSEGKFAGKYTAMLDKYSCSKRENIGLTIKVRGADITVLDKEVSYCFENLISTTMNYPSFNINLKSLLSVESPIEEDDVTHGWSWTNSTAFPGVPEYKHLVTAESAEKFKSGDISVNTEVLQTLLKAGKLSLPLKFAFNYKYVDCDGKELDADLTIIFTDKLKDVVTDKFKSVCRNLWASNLNIANYFGFDVPVTASNWSEIVNGVRVPMGSGIINLDTLVLGTEYAYRYYVSGAAETLCDLAGVDATFRLKVKDVEMQSAAATICKEVFDQNKKINLFDFVMGLSDENRIDPNNDITWCVYGNNPNDCAEILNPKEYQMGLFNGVVPTFKFKYDTDCGVSEGQLYVSVLDVIPVEEHHKEIILCFTDDYASSINLFEVLSIMGLDGEFTSSDIAKDGVIFNGKIFNASKAFTPDPSNAGHKETYIFEYENVDGDCLSEKATVKVVVTQSR